MKLQLQRHRVAEIFGAIGHPSAIKADMCRIFGQGLDLFEQFLTGQYAKMPLMVTRAFLFHVVSFLW